MPCTHTVCVFDYPVPSRIRIFCGKRMCADMRGHTLHVYLNDSYMGMEMGCDSQSSVTCNRGNAVCLRRKCLTENSYLQPEK